MKASLFKIFVCAVIGVCLYIFINSNERSVNTDYPTTYSYFIDNIRNDMVREVTIQGNVIQGILKNGEKFTTINPDDPKLIDELLEFDVKIRVAEEDRPSFLAQVFVSWAPMILLICVWIYFFRKQQQGGGMGGQMGFGKSKAKLMEEDQVKIRFKDVAGCEEAKQDVVEMVDFLKEPGKYQVLGGQIPRGLLMVGPPGTGKTLLAKAIAGEAEVPFFFISGSDFVEMFVGVGASRVRDMFNQAKEKAPCIIFIDEIDAVGRQRGGNGFSGGNEEREQTLNQLLVEMDGFNGNEGIIVIAATNRADVLDKALLRPGRFDRQVNVSLPDIRGREQILNVHIQKVPQSEDVNLHDLACGTPGFSGAELANLINEGALFAARRNKTKVSMSDLDSARDKMIMGAERESMVMSHSEKLMTAYHEAGHAIVGRLVPDHDPVYKVSIMPRNGALGITMFLPEKDQFSASREKLESQIASLYGGRVAEELIYGKHKVTTGASNDIERATQTATNMVTQWGLSDKLGARKYADPQNQNFMGGQSQQNSEQVAQLIDDEINNMLELNYQKAKQLLEENIQILHNMADALMRWETIDKFQIDELMQGTILPDPPAVDLAENFDNTSESEETTDNQNNKLENKENLAF